MTLLPSNDSKRPPDCYNHGQRPTGVALKSHRVQKASRVQKTYCVLCSDGWYPRLTRRFDVHEQVHGETVVGGGVATAQSRRAVRRSTAGLGYIQKPKILRRSSPLPEHVGVIHATRVRRLTPNAKWFNCLKKNKITPITPKWNSAASTRLRPASAWTTTYCAYVPASQKAGSIGR